MSREDKKTTYQYVAARVVVIPVCRRRPALPPLFEGSFAGGVIFFPTLVPGSSRQRPFSTN